MTERYLFAGAIAWLLTTEYFIVQAFVASKWTVDFDITTHAISDLGAVTCGNFGGREVCSPWHLTMNIGFIVIGVLMAAGAYLLYRHYQRAKYGFLMIALSGLGAIIVGLFPEDTVESIHITGAALSFITGGVGLIWCGARTAWPQWLKAASIALGIISLGALTALTINIYEPLGFGLVERFVSYPITVWLMLVGGYALYDYNARR